MKNKPRYLVAVATLAALVLVWIGIALADEPSTWDLIDQAAAAMMPVQAEPVLTISDSTLRELRDGDCLKVRGGNLERIDCNEHCAKEARTK